MADCSYCGKPAGFLKKFHPDCSQKFESGKKQIVELTERCIRKEIPISNFEDTKTIAANSFINDALRLSEIVQGWDNVVDKYLQEGVITKEQEQTLMEFCSATGMGQDILDKNDGFTRVVRSAVLRDILEGKMPKRLSTDIGLPINYQKGEELIWAFPSVKYYEDKNRTTFVGRSQGVSIKVTKGVYYRTGTFKGTPIVTQERVYVDTGIFAFTNKNIYFISSTKSLRIPYNKIVSYTPYSDGIGLIKDNATAKPQTFITGDGGFTYNAIMNISQGILENDGRTIKQDQTTEGHNPLLDQ